MEYLVIFESFLSLLSCLLNLLLLYILRRYLVFHDHLRSLVFQSHLFLLLSNLFVLFRGVSFLLHFSSQSSHSFTSSPSNEDPRPFCPSSSSPSYFIGLFLVLSIGISVERSYATMKFDIYERFTKHGAVTKGIGVFWLFSISFCLLSSLPLSISPTRCNPPHYLTTAVNEANLALIIFAVFFVSFIPIFLMNYKKNEETLKNYVKQDYSSLSSRYQLKENTTTCKTFLVQNGSCFLLCLFMLLLKAVLTNEWSFQREIQFFFYPLAGLLISLNFLVLHDSVKRKLKTMYGDSRDVLLLHWTNSIHWRKEAAEDPLLPA